MTTANRAPRDRAWWGGLLVLILGLALVAFAATVAAEEGEEGDDAPPQLGNREVEDGQRVGRETMWRPPTAEDWAKPVLIKFQRTWNDAVAVAKETGKPILICINMDGEIASEHYAGVRYRQPEIAELYKPYVCVIASVYRHNPRDHDDEGHRILCPRFGSVTCGEHISIEPTIYEKYCEGQRVAPRHIMVDLKGDEVYDVFYTDDSASVFDAIRDGPEEVPAPKPTIVRGDRPVLERVASRHTDDRKAVEEAYQKGDADLRRQLLEAAMQHADAAQLDLMRLAIFGLDVDLSRLARKALSETDEAGATQLISESMQVPMDATEREALIAALKRLGESSKLARWLAGVHEGLAARSEAVDPSGWAGAADASTPVEAPTDAELLSAQAEYQAEAAAQNPEDPALRLKLANTNLDLALRAREAYPMSQRMARMVSEHLYADARRVALEAEKLGASGWPVDSILALAAYYAGDLEEAYAKAETAMKDLPKGDGTWRSMAVVSIFAESRWKGIKAAVKAKEKWPKEWLADLHAAYAVLQRHPLGTDGQVIWHYEFLVWLGAEHRAGRVLRGGLERWPDSPALHEKLRKRLLKHRGPEFLEATYDRMLGQEDASDLLPWYAGVASVTTAEQHWRANRYEKALQAFARAIAYFHQVEEGERIIKEGVDHAVALARAGRARVAYIQGDDNLALEEVLASFQLSPASAGSRDGMGFTPGETGQVLLARLLGKGKMDLAKSLKAVLESLDPELLRPDRY